MNQAEENTFPIEDYLEIAKRRKWYITVPFIVILVTSLILCFVLPKVYKASTTILVIPKRMSEDFVKSTITINPSEYLNVISEEILSRTRLEKVIHELSLFPEIIQKRPMEVIIEQMRGKIEVNVLETFRTGQTRGVASFTISYIDKDPQTVAKTANRLASLFMEENLRSREEQARSTTDFFIDELEVFNTILKAQEKKIGDFKQRNIGSLPAQSDANLRILDQLILQSQRISDDLNDNENRKILLQQQLLLQNDSESFPLSLDEKTAREGSLQSLINTTKSKLVDLKSKYTENHPDVISTKAELEKLLSLLDTEERPGAGDVFGVSTPVMSEIEQQILSTNLNITKLKNDEKLINDKIIEYQAKIELAPKLEQELALIMRDYDNTKDAYDKLMQKKIAAEQAEKLEINQKGEQFKVLDVAKVPAKPFKPDKTKVLLLGFIIAICASLGLCCFIEFLDKSFYKRKELESYLGLPVIITIPQIQQPEKS